MRVASLSIRERYVAILLLVALIGLLASALCLGESAEAHTGGKAIPKIDVAVTPQSSAPLTQDITVTITDADSGSPVTGAEVTIAANMETIHEMELEPVTVPPTAVAGKYATALRLLMAAEWKLIVAVGGATVQPATQEVIVRASFGNVIESEPDPQASTRVTQRPPTKISGSLTLGDVLPIASLAIHSAAAVFWVLATLLLMFAADPAGRGWLTDERREAIGGEKSWYRRAALGAGLLVVATGLFNGLVAAPFTLTPTPGAIATAMRAPFGTLYLVILGAKIAIFVAIVVVNRLTGEDEDDRADAAHFALRADLVLLPLLLLAVVMLRYVHILSHVAQAAS